MSVHWEGVDAWLHGLDALPGQVDDISLDTAGQLLAQDVADRLPRRTNQLAGSVQIHTETDLLAVFAAAPYAPPVIVGVPTRNLPAHPVMEAAITAREAAITTDLETGLAQAINAAGL